MNINIQKIMVTNETVRIIYPSKNPVFEGKRALLQSDTGAWRGDLAIDLRQKTLLADLINQQHDALFACNISASDKIRKIQAIDPVSLKLSEFFIGGQILMFISKHKTFSDKIYLHDRIEDYTYLGHFLSMRLNAALEKMEFSDIDQYRHGVILSIDINI